MAKKSKVRGQNQKAKYQRIAIKENWQNLNGPRSDKNGRTQRSAVHEKFTKNLTFAIKKVANTQKFCGQSKMGKNQRSVVKTNWQNFEGLR